MESLSSRALLIVSFIGLTPFLHAQQAQFIAVRNLPGGGVPWGAVNDTSADNSVLVGQMQPDAYTCFFEAFRWTAATGTQRLGDLPGGDCYSVAAAVSGDGSVIVGDSRIGPGYEAMRWTAAGGMVDLDLPAHIIDSHASDVSADGSVIVGWGGFSPATGGFEAFRWTESGGLVGLGTLAAPPSPSYARAVSADGSVVVGHSGLAPPRAFRWTAATGMVDLGSLPGGADGEALDASADGNFVVGWSGSSSGRQAYRWTAAGGMVGLGDLPGGPFNSAAMGCSADGRIVTGTSFTGASTQEAFVWTPTRGMINIKSELIAQGVTSVSGWQLQSARVSDDGTVFFGNGFSPAGIQEGWLAFLTVGLPLGSSYCGPALPNSTGSPGILAANGSDVIALDDFRITARQLPSGSFGYFLVGQTQGLTSPPGSQGLLCLAGNIGRYSAPAQIIVGPTGYLQLDLTSIPVNPPQAALPGQTWNFQCWYRDMNPQLTSNFTDGISVTFQ